MQAGAGAAWWVPTLLLAMLSVVRLSWTQQALAAIALLMVGCGCAGARRGSTRRLCLVLLAGLASLRYVAWRTGAVWLAVQAARGSRWWSPLFTAMPLLLAEIFVLLCGACHVFVTLWPCDRKPVPLPAKLSAWPAVDVLVYAADQPMDQVQSTLLAALAMDWPADRRRLLLVDPDRQPALQRLARETGATYVTDDPEAEREAEGPAASAQPAAAFAVVLTAGHAPVRSLLQVTLGAFLVDPSLALLTCAQGGEREAAVRAEQGRDLWNAVHCTGAIAVLRRAAIEATGASLAALAQGEAALGRRLQRGGWTTAFLAVPQVAGESPDDKVSRAAGTRRTQARRRVTGTPFRSAQGRLTLAQRVCDWTTDCSTALRIAITVVACGPVLYPAFGQWLVPGSWQSLLVYLVPHLLLALAVAAAWREPGWHRSLLRGHRAPQRARRRRVRRRWHGPARLTTEHGKALEGQVLDLSAGGVCLRASAHQAVSPGTSAQLALHGGPTVPVHVVSTRDGDLHLAFGRCSLPQQEQLTRLMFTPADAWLDQAPRPTQAAARPWGVLCTMTLGVACLLLLLAAGAHAPAAIAKSRNQAADFRMEATFAQLAPGAGGLQPPEAPWLRVPFAVPHRVLVQAGELHLRFVARAAPHTAPERIVVVLNGAPIEKIVPPVSAAATTVVVPLPPEWLVERNELSFFAVQQNRTRGRVGVESVPVHVDPASTVVLRGKFLQARATGAGRAYDGQQGAKHSRWTALGAWLAARKRVLLEALVYDIFATGCCVVGALLMRTRLMELAAFRMGGRNLHAVAKELVR